MTEGFPWLAPWDFWDSCQTHVLGLTMTLSPKIQHLFQQRVPTSKLTHKTYWRGKKKLSQGLRKTNPPPPPSFNHHKLATLILTVGIIRKKKNLWPFLWHQSWRASVKKKRPQAQFILIQNKQYYVTFITIKYLHDNPWNISTWPLVHSGLNASHN